jgi:protein-S-isoprenylcysteine O-methyltransferase Ste14
MRQLVVFLKTVFMAGCAIAIFGAITRQLRNLDRFIPLVLPSWMVDAGILLMGAGAILCFVCFGLFALGGALTPGPAFPDPGVFISRGPYKYVRNPMAEGGLVALAGWGAYRLSVSTLILVVVMAGLMHLIVVYIEEPKLERRFGQSYRRYRSRVGRWFPTGTRSGGDP